RTSSPSLPDVFRHVQFSPLARLVPACDYPKTPIWQMNRKRVREPQAASGAEAHAVSALLASEPVTIADEDELLFVSVLVEPALCLLNLNSRARNCSIGY